MQCSLFWIQKVIHHQMGRNENPSQCGAGIFHLSLGYLSFTSLSAIRVSSLSELPKVPFPLCHLWLAVNCNHRWNLCIQSKNKISATLELKHNLVVPILKKMHFNMSTHYSTCPNHQ